MPKFAANLSMMFTETEFPNRFGKAAHAGFTKVEFQFPFNYPKEQIAEQVEKYNLSVILHNLPAGDWDNGDRGIACHPHRIGEFQDGVGIAIEYASSFGCKKLNSLSGIMPNGIAEDIVHGTFVENLKFASEKLNPYGIQLLIEPINTRDVPGIYLKHTDQALSILEKVGSNNVGLQYDIYHMQIMEGDLTRTLEDNIKQISHVQIADNPGRNEPGTGEINYPFLFNVLDRIGYQGWVGCEYKPLSTTQAGLAWLNPYLKQ